MSDFWDLGAHTFAMILASYIASILGPHGSVRVCFSQGVWYMRAHCRRLVTMALVCAACPMSLPHVVGNGKPLGHSWVEVCWCPPGSHFGCGV